MAIYERTNALLSVSQYKATYTCIERPIYGSDRLGNNNISPLIGEVEYTHPATPQLLPPPSISTPIPITLADVSIDAVNVDGQIFSLIHTSHYQFDADMPQNSIPIMAVPGKNMATAVNQFGQTVLMAKSLKKYHNQSNILLLTDGSGNLIRNSNGINCDWRGQSLFTQVPGNPSRYYLITTGADKKAYYHLIDITQGMVLEKNISLGDKTGYGAMTLLEDHSNHTLSRLYLLRYDEDEAKAEIVSCLIKEDKVELFSEVASFDAPDAGAVSAMQLSPNGSRMAIISNTGAPLAYTLQRAQAGIRVYDISTDDSPWESPSVHALSSNAAASSVCFSPQGNYLYFTQATAGHTKLKRIELSTSAVSTYLPSVSGAVAPHTDGNLYAASGTQLLIISQPDAAVPGFDNLQLQGAAHSNNNLLAYATKKNFVFSPSIATFARTTNKKQYELKDHLGNVRATVSDIKEPVYSTGSPVVLLSFTADLRSVMNYYSFACLAFGEGMEMPGRCGNSGNYRYGFNTQEKDDEIYGSGNSYTAEYWQYDSRLGRRWNIDPMAHERESLTPYNFCSNNPINRVDPDGALDDWVQNIETSEYEWMDNVTSADNTPEGYKYVGSQDADILKDLGVSYSFPEQSSNRIGYVAADVEMGRYAVNHLINVKAKSNVSISAVVSYNLLGGTENNRLGKKFEGIKVSATVIGSNSGADGTVNAYSNLTVGYGGKTYTAGMGEPQLPYLKQTGTSVAVGSVNIPASNLSRSNSFSGVSVSGGWWVTNSANMRTPVVYHPLTPVPQTFKHSWTFPKR